MATADTNLLPEFATEPQDNTFDEEIVNKTSSLERTGFVPNTAIRSAQNNTYIKMMIEGFRGLVDSLYREATEQGAIKANSTAAEWQDYIKKGLNDTIVKTTVNSASSLSSKNVGDSTHPVYFNANGQPAAITKVASASNADSATKLSTKRTISLAGDAEGSTTFDGTGNASINVNVSKATSLKSTNVGSENTPVYFDAAGTPKATGAVLRNDISGNAATATTATKLQTPRNIALTGDVVGNANFDGSSNIEIETSTTIANAKTMVNSGGAVLNVGSSGNPVYFKNGVPVATKQSAIALTFVGVAQKIQGGAITGSSAINVLEGQITNFLTFNSGYKLIVQAIIVDNQLGGIKTFDYLIPAALAMTQFEDVKNVGAMSLFSANSKSAKTLNTDYGSKSGTQSSDYFKIRAIMLAYPNENYYDHGNNDDYGN